MADLTNGAWISDFVLEYYGELLNRRSDGARRLQAINATGDELAVFHAYPLHQLQMYVQSGFDKCWLGKPEVGLSHIYATIALNLRPPVGGQFLGA